MYFFVVTLQKCSKNSINFSESPPFLMFWFIVIHLGCHKHLLYLRSYLKSSISKINTPTILKIYMKCQILLNVLFFTVSTDFENPPPPQVKFLSWRHILKTTNYWFQRSVWWQWWDLSKSEWLLDLPAHDHNTPDILWKLPG